jgi:hypothetical protein
MKKTKPHNGHTNDPPFYPQNCDTDLEMLGNRGFRSCGPSLRRDGVLFLRRQRGIIARIESDDVKADQDLFHERSDPN